MAKLTLAELGKRVKALEEQVGPQIQTEDLGGGMWAVSGVVPGETAAISPTVPDFQEELRGTNRRIDSLDSIVGRLRCEHRWAYTVEPWGDDIIVTSRCERCGESVRQQLFSNTWLGRRKLARLLRGKE